MFQGMYVSVDERNVCVAGEQRLILAVQVPPISNHRLKGGVRKSSTGKRYVGFRQSTESKMYQRTIRSLCQVKRLVPFAGDVGVKIRWYRKRKAGDVMDRWKDLFDALQSKQRDAKTKKVFDTGVGVFYDDAQVADFRVIRDDSEKNNPRCIVEIWKLT